ncbi:MAG TPA: phage gp6-like head-tail connector protein [Anaerolineae bacterium]|nr:phage gp6-like head-tail connector protein [Anaerolineae bacterium]
MAYTTVADLKTYLGLSGSGDDALLATLIEAAQAMLEHEIGDVFEAAADTTRYFDAVADVEGRTLYFDRYCASITSITNGDGNAVAAGDYVTEPRNGSPIWAVTLKSGASASWTYDDSPENAIAVTGRWAVTTTAPADIVQATIRLAAYLYRQRDAQVFDVTAMPELGQITIPKGTPADVWAIIRYWRSRLRRIPR